MGVDQMPHWSDQHKRVPPSAILQKLPANLEKLTIFDDYLEENLPILANVLQQSPASPPFCEQLTLFTRSPEHLARDALAGPAQEKDIQLRIISLSPLSKMVNEGDGGSIEDSVWEEVPDVVSGEIELAVPSRAEIEALQRHV